MSLVWINGQLVDKSEAKISVFDHGFLYGDGVWEHFRAFNGKLFQAELGADILFRSARVLGIDIPLSQSEIIDAIGSTIRANDRAEGYIRAIVTRGTGTLGPDPRKIDPVVLIVVEEYHPFPRELLEVGIHAVTAPIRVDLANPTARTRTLGRPHIVLAKRNALKLGCFETVLLTNTEIVGGATEGNVFAAHAGKLTTHPDLYVDSTAALVPRLVESHVKMTGMRLDGLRAADELFLAGTSCGVIGIVQLDGKPIGTGREGPITKQIREAYRKLTRGEA